MRPTSTPTVTPGAAPACAVLNEHRSWLNARRRACARILLLQGLGSRLADVRIDRTNSWTGYNERNAILPGQVPRVPSVEWEPNCAARPFDRNTPAAMQARAVIGSCPAVRPVAAARAPCQPRRLRMRCAASAEPVEKVESVAEEKAAAPKADGSPAAAAGFADVQRPPRIPIEDTILFQGRHTHSHAHRHARVLQRSLPYRTMLPLVQLALCLLPPPCAGFGWDSCKDGAWYKKVESMIPQLQVGHRDCSGCVSIAVAEPRRLTCQPPVARFEVLPPAACACHLPQPSQALCQPRPDQQELIPPQTPPSACHRCPAADTEVPSFELCHRSIDDRSEPWLSFPAPLCRPPKSPTCGCRPPASPWPLRATSLGRCELPPGLCSLAFPLPASLLCRVHQVSGRYITTGLACTHPPRQQQHTFRGSCTPPAQPD
jgi:hypothetical protein